MHLCALPQQRLADPLPPSALATAFVRASTRLGLSDKELADALGISAPTWSKQKTGADGHRMQVQRFGALPDGYRELFLDALLEELARVRGRVVVVPGGQFAALSKAMRALSEVVEQLGTAQAPLPFDLAKGA